MRVYFQAPLCVCVCVLVCICVCVSVFVCFMCVCMCVFVSMYFQAPLTNQSYLGHSCIKSIKAVMMNGRLPAMCGHFLTTRS